MRDVTWQSVLLAETDFETININSNCKVTPEFDSGIFQRWDAANTELNSAVANERNRVCGELEKQLDQGLTIGISLTLVGGPPLFTFSFSSGPWTLGVSTDFSSVIKLLPTWNNIGLPIPIKIGQSYGMNTPAPVEKDADFYGAQPIAKDVAENQARSDTFSVSRSGNTILSGPACYMDMMGSQNADPSGWFLYLSSLVGNSPNWTPAKAQLAVGAFLQCKTAAEDRTPCNVFVYSVLKGVFGIDDLSSPDTRANDMADYLAGKPGLWEKIGDGKSQNALTRAQAEANAGKAVVAVWKNPSGSLYPGHVALIIPGVLKGTSRN